MDADFELNAVEKALYARAAAKRVPIYGGFELTPYCNLSCKMCYVHETAPGLPVLSGEQWLDFGRQAAEAGTLAIVLTGGEPMLHPDFKQIYTGLKKLGMVITMNTNATYIDEEMADFLAADMPRRVNVSLYGPNEEVYEKLCGNRAGFHKTIRAIELMQERNIPVKINIVPNTINYEYLDEMLELCGKYQLTVEMTVYLFEPIRKMLPGQQQYRLEPEQMAEALLKWHFYRYSQEDMMNRAMYSYYGLVKFEESRKAEGLMPIRCHAGNSSFWLCWDGTMNACVNMVQPKADVRKLGFAGAWEQVKKEGEAIRVPAKCSQCSLSKLCLTCAAIGYHQNGTFEKEPTIMCKATECYARRLVSMIRRAEEGEKQYENEEKSGSDS